MRKALPDLGRASCPIRAPLNQLLSGLVPEAAKKNKNQIQHPADTEEAGSEQPDDACADFTDIEAVSAKVAQEQAQEEGNPLPLMDVAEIFVDIGVLIHNVNHGLLRSCTVLGCAAVRAELRVPVNHAATIFAIHSIPLLPALY